MILRVTADDIRDGQPRQSDACPIALALQRQTLTPIVSVGNDTASLVSSAERQYRLSWRARRFIHRFDWGKRVRPSTFLLLPTK